MRSLIFAAAVALGLFVVPSAVFAQKSNTESQSAQKSCCEKECNKNACPLSNNKFDGHKNFLNKLKGKLRNNKTECPYLKALRECPALRKCPHLRAVYLKHLLHKYSDKCPLSDRLHRCPGCERMKKLDKKRHYHEQRHRHRHHHHHKYHGKKVPR